MRSTAAGPRARPLRRAAPWFVASLTLLAVGLPAALAAPHLPSALEVGYARPIVTNNSTQVNMTDQPRYAPMFLTATVDANATFHLVNGGTYAHSFTVLKQPNVQLNTSWTPAQLNQYLAANGTLANVTVAGGAQANVTVFFNATTGFDSFEFLSVVPYQFQAGMYGLINVSSNAPGYATSENTTDAPAFLPGVLSAPWTGHPINLDVLVTNMGNDGHTFTVVAQTNVTLPTSQQGYQAYFAVHPPLVMVTVPSGAGMSVWANFTVLTPGIFQYICTITGHYASGMSGELYVGVAVPPQPAAPSTAVIQVWVLVGSAVLLGIGMVVALVAIYSGRFPPTSPPAGHH